MKFRGHPWLGGISGFFLGVFAAIDLQQFSIRPLDNLSVIGLPLIGLVLGLAWSYWGPLRRSPPAAVGEPPIPGPGPSEEPPPPS